MEMSASPQRKRPAARSARHRVEPSGIRSPLPDRRSVEGLIPSYDRLDARGQISVYDMVVNSYNIDIGLDTLTLSQLLVPDTEYPEPGDVRVLQFYKGNNEVYTLSDGVFVAKKVPIGKESRALAEQRNIELLGDYFNEGIMPVHIPGRGHSTMMVPTRSYLLQHPEEDAQHPAIHLIEKINGVCLDKVLTTIFEKGQGRWDAQIHNLFQRMIDAGMTFQDQLERLLKGSEDFQDDSVDAKFYSRRFEKKFIGELETFGVNLSRSQTRAIRHFFLVEVNDPLLEIPDELKGVYTSLKPLNMMLVPEDPTEVRHIKAGRIPRDLTDRAQLARIDIEYNSRRFRPSDAVLGIESNPVFGDSEKKRKRYYDRIAMHLVGNQDPAAYHKKQDFHWYKKRFREIYGFPMHARAAAVGEESYQQLIRRSAIERLAIAGIGTTLRYIRGIDEFIERAGLCEIVDANQAVEHGRRPSDSGKVKLATSSQIELAEQAYEERKELVDAVKYQVRRFRKHLTSVQSEGTEDGARYLRNAVDELLNNLDYRKPE